MIRLARGEPVNGCVLKTKKRTAAGLKMAHARGTPTPMNLASGYLGLPLRSPFVVGASPFCDDLRLARELEEAGAGAVVMRSLFEEQMVPPAYLAPGTRTGFPEFAGYQFSPEGYLRHLEQLKGALSIPVIASLNGHRPGSWLEYAPLLEQSGADAIELNFYQVVADPTVDADRIETDMLETVGEVVGGVNIPVAVKLSPFHASMAQLAIAMELAGASGVVVFNRFFQADVSTRDLQLVPRLQLSAPGELLLRLRWLAILSPLLRGSLAVTGGVQTADDVVKSILSGAHVVQLVSALLKHGPPVIVTLRTGLEGWMRRHGHTALESFRGRLNSESVGDAAAFERANYIRVLQSWKK